MEGVFFTIVLIAAAVDLYGHLAFSLGYFRLGIPLYRTRLPWNAVVVPAGLDHYLTDRMHSDALPSLVFRRLSESEIGFREKHFEWGFKWRYTPMMHGIIVFSPTERAAVITGRMNWYPLTFSALIVSTLLNATIEARLLIACFMFAVLGACYVSQLSRYRSTATVLQDHLRAST